MIKEKEGLDLVINEKTLDLIKVGFRRLITEDKILYSPSIDVLMERERDAFRCSFRGFLLGHKQENIVIKYPLDWWQSVKKEFFPKFLLQKYPVIYMIHDINWHVLYPKIDLAFPEKEHIIKFYEFTITGIK